MIGDRLIGACAQGKGDDLAREDRAVADVIGIGRIECEALPILDVGKPDICGDAVNDEISAPGTDRGGVEFQDQIGLYDPSIAEIIVEVVRIEQILRRDDKPLDSADRAEIGQAPWKCW